MANTFNLGNGNWAQKTEKLLAYNAENDNYKPLPFDFDRGSTATRVNKNGLIETVGVDEPRIDFLNNTKGHLLLEPSRTNLIPYSEDFSQWSLSNATISTNQSISPDGTLNADKLIPNSTLSVNKYIYTIPTTSNGIDYTLTVFAKEGEYDMLRLEDGNNSQGAWFDLSNGTLGTVGASVTAKIQNYGNGWYRCSVTKPSVSTSVFFVISASNTESIQVGDGTSGVYIFGAQIEEGSYATSYIPTSGSAVTRSLSNIFSDDLNNLGLINDTEGVFYTEIKMPISSTRDISAGGLVFGNTSVWAGSRAFEISKDSDGSFRIAKRDSGFSVLADIVAGVYYKIAFKWDSLNVYLYVNGSLVTTSTYTQTDFKYIFTDNRDSQKFIKEIKLYNTALSDSELQALTS